MVAGPVDVVFSRLDSTSIYGFTFNRFPSGFMNQWFKMELNPRMKHIVGTANRRISNKKFRMMKCGIASGFASGYDPTGRSDYFRLI